ncbi:hypothetical protein NDU88_011018 [Pleurodeles waltl]|uniref:Uncharacterized protein n=1 Tax=Pleurodeles waltl TaxID=8319 RepID=A0AAV7S2R4_PLEWA|nr:hypothetical protein NDU88_011018 [Pleurodeles waltl]
MRGRGLRIRPAGHSTTSGRGRASQMSAGPADPKEHRRLADRVWHAPVALRVSEWGPLSSTPEGPQGRPLTSWLPLPSSMCLGEQRHLRQLSQAGPPLPDRQDQQCPREQTHCSPSPQSPIATCHTPASWLCDPGHCPRPQRDAARDYGSPRGYTPLRLRIRSRMSGFMQD